MIHYKGKIHQAPRSELGILLVNLGTPDAPTPQAVRHYLAEFLTDPRVVELPRWLWLPILHGIILRIRPARSAHNYQKIWTEHGSPLLAISQRLTTALQIALRQQFITESLTVVLGMRYGKPSIVSALENLRQLGIKRLLVLPLYPQYSSATTGATFDAVTKELCNWRCVPELRIINNYYDQPLYLEALAQTIREVWKNHQPPKRLLFSFHGLPKRVVDDGDPYAEQCLSTARGVSARLKLTDEQWAISFQSRFGREEWLRPYTDEILRTWAATGTERVDVICPGFAVDCLETLEEIALQNRELFIKSGGNDYHYIPALNEHFDHLKMLINLILNHLHGWY